MKIQDVSSGLAVRRNARFYKAITMEGRIYPLDQEQYALIRVIRAASIYAAIIVIFDGALD